MDQLCETRPPNSQPHKYHWLISERATYRIIGEWIPAEGFWLLSGEEPAGISPADMWRRGWRWSAAVGAQPEPERVCVFQDWLFDLTMQQQSVLVLACRGPDGIGKVHPTKAVVARYRATVLKAAYLGRPMQIDESDDSTFMTLERFSDDHFWAHNVKSFFDFVDGIQNHYYMHLMHGAQIAGYKHPLELMRKRWNEFYLRCCHDLHLYPENEDQMDHRLSDWYQKHWDGK